MNVEIAIGLAVIAGFVMGLAVGIFIGYIEGANKD